MSLKQAYGVNNTKTFNLLIKLRIKAIIRSQIYIINVNSSTPNCNI